VGLRFKSNILGSNKSTSFLSRLICIIVMSCLAFSVVSTASTSALATQNPPANAYGIAAGGGLPLLSQAALTSEMEGIKAMGGTWVRFDFNWNQIQTYNGTSYNWAPADRVVAAAQKQGLNVLGIIDYIPSWASRSSCTGASCGPVNPKEFAAFAGEVAARYSSQVSDWEIWNEENDSIFWGPSANVVNYANLLKVTYPAIKLASPTATVIVGGLSPVVTSNKNISPSDFLKGLYANGAGPFFDAVADHPYTYPVSPNALNSSWENMSVGSNSLRSIMIANGDSSKKIWITEFGAPTNGPSRDYFVTQFVQAQMLAQAAMMYKSYNWVGPFFWFTYQDGASQANSNTNSFGLLNYDQSPKPAYAVFNLYAKGYL
jgi:hypothetical protein